MVKWLVTTMLIMASMNAGASTAQHSHSAFGELAAKALEEKAQSRGLDSIQVEVFPLDGRVNLPECAEQVSVLSEHNQTVLGRVTVGMRCQTPEPWTIYLRGRVTSSITIPVLTQPVNRSELIGDDDVVLRKLQIDADLRGVIIDRNHMVGKVAVRNLIAGQPLRQSDVTAPKLISRGQSVTITSTAGGLIVTMKGKALSNARAGDRVWVQNQSSNKRVEGEVTPEGAVLVR